MFTVKQAFFEHVFAVKSKPETPCKKELIQKLVKEVLFNSTAQAILKIYQTSNALIKILWSFCLMVSFSLCAYFVIESMITFVSYEVNTKIRSYSEQTSLFPKAKIKIKPRTSF